MKRWPLLMMWHAMAAIGSWIIGAVALLAWAAVESGRVLTWHDGSLPYFLMWWFIVYAPVVPIVYLPCLLALRWWRNGCHPAILFPLLGGLLGALPVVVIMSAWHAHKLVSLEAGRLFVLFGSAGAAFGLMYAWRHNRVERFKPRGFEPIVRQI